MNEQEKINDLQRFSALDSRVSNLETKFEMFIGEMRDRDNQRHAEISELRNSIREFTKATNAKFDEFNKATDDKITKIETKLDSITSHIQILTITAMGGIIAAGVGLAAMVYSILNK